MDTITNNNKPKVGVSQCLLGHAVRYDGASKPNDTIINELDKIFDLVPICPEVEAGLGIPRPAVQLTEDLSNPNVTGRDDPSLDITLQMHDYCKQKTNQLSGLAGFIFKSRSPSCGLNSTPVFIDNLEISLTSRGMFARAITRTFPELPVIEETEFVPRDALENFIEEVMESHKRLNKSEY